MVMSFYRSPYGERELKLRSTFQVRCQIDRSPYGERELKFLLLGLSL